MSFRAEAIRHARFDEHVRGTSAEDLDFCLQLQRGSILLVTPRARLEHRHGSAGRSRAHWVYTDVERASYIFWKHWRRNATNWLWFVWLLSGYALAGLIQMFWRFSLVACRGLIHGVADGVSEARAACAAGDGGRT
jgi:GT2 family glycosyltransferase